MVMMITITIIIIIAANKPDIVIKDHNNKSFSTIRLKYLIKTTEKTLQI